MFERNNRNANTIGTPGTAAIAERPATGNHQVSEFIDPFFTKTSLKRSFSMVENEHFGLVFETRRQQQQECLSQSGCKQQQ
jgi:hypothetical protein